MTLKADARLIRFRGYFLVSTGSKAIEVNRTFADVWDLASNGKNHLRMIWSRVTGSPGMKRQMQSRKYLRFGRNTTY